MIVKTYSDSIESALESKKSALNVKHTNLFIF